MDELLRALVERGGSDLHVTVGIAPVMRVNGALEPVEGPALSAADTQRLVLAIMSDERRRVLESEREAD